MACKHNKYFLYPRSNQLKEARDDCVNGHKTYKKNEWQSLARYLHIKNKPQVNKDLVFQSVVGGCCRMGTPPCFF
jgi:hypothetical protein